jgi:hypothetical protein
MSALVRHTVPLERFEFPPQFGPWTEASRTPGTPEWGQLATARLGSYVDQSSDYGSAARLRDYLAELLEEPKKPWEVWPAGNPCKTLDIYFQRCGGKNCEQVIALIEKWLGDTALAEKLRAAQTAADVEHRPHGGARRGSGFQAAISRLKMGGTTTPAVLRRIARAGRQDVLDDYANGKFKSVQAAARAAGVAKPPPSVLVLCHRLWARMTKAERRRFMATHAVDD